MTDEERIDDMPTPAEGAVDEQMVESLKLAQGAEPINIQVPPAPVPVPAAPASRNDQPQVGNVAGQLSPSAFRQASVTAKPVNDTFRTPVAFKFSFIGLGQGGGRISDAFYGLGYRRVCLFNTTDSDFDGLNLEIPRMDTGIGGAMKDMSIARNSLQGRDEEVWDLMRRAWGDEVDYAFICACLGGGTGSGTAKPLVELARKYMKDNVGKKAKVGAIVALPPVAEGYQICRNAVNSFQELVKLGVSPLIVLDNARIDELYKPTMMDKHQTANRTVTTMLHLFNELAAIHSQFITFDPSELAQLLDSGVVVMGMATVNKFDSPADVSTAIREQLANNVLAKVDLTRGRKAACLFVGSKDILSRLGLEYFEAGYSQLDRMLGSAYGEGTQTVVHRGLYLGSDPGLQAYTMIGELDLPRDRLQELAAKGGLFNETGSRSRIAEFLGVQDEAKL